MKAAAQSSFRRLLQRLPLRARFFLIFLGMALLPLSLVAIFDNQATQRALTQAGYQGLLAAATQTSLRLDSFIAAKTAVVAGEAQMPALSEFLAAPPPHRDLKRTRVLDMLRAFAQKDSAYISSYALLDIEGRNLVDTRRENTGRNEAGREYFRQTLTGGRSHVSGIEFSERNEIVLYFSSIVRDSADRPLGILRCSYDASIFQNIVLQTTGLLGAGSFAILLNEDQVFLAHGLLTSEQLGARLFKVLSPVNPERINQLQSRRHLPQAAPAQWQVELPGLAEGVAKAGSAAPFFTVNLPLVGPSLQVAAATQMKTRPWTIAFLQPRDVLLAPVHQHIFNTLLLGLAIVGVVLAAAFYFARKMTAPLLHMTRVAQDVAQGNLHARVVVDRHDELGVLAATFNTMTGKLAVAMNDIRRNEEKFMALFQMSPDAILLATADSVHSAFVNVNRAFEEMSGYRCEELIGKTVAEMKIWENGEELCKVLCLVLAGEVVLDYQTGLRHKDGHIVPVSLSSRKIMINGQPRILAIRRDISERLRQQEVERRHSEQLIHINRLATIGEMGSALAHELNQPLAAISNYCGVIRWHLEKPDPALEKLRELAGFMEQQALRSGRVIECMRAFVSKREAEYAALPVESIVEGVIRLARVEADARAVAIELALEPALPPVLANQLQIEQVLLNLIRNGIEAMDGVAGNRRLVVGARLCGEDGIELRVQDCGRGLPAQAQVLDEKYPLFFTTKPNGLGMGLSISRSIVEAHHGRLWATPNEGAGTTFHFTLPIAEVQQNV